MAVLFPNTSDLFDLASKRQVSAQVPLTRGNVF